MYCFRSLRWETPSFFLAAVRWVLTVFSEMWRSPAMLGLLQPRAASMHTANSVVVRSSATSWPVMGLWTRRQPAESDR